MGDGRAGRRWAGALTLAVGLHAVACTQDEIPGESGFEQAPLGGGTLGREGPPQRAPRDASQPEGQPETDDAGEPERTPEDGGRYTDATIAQPPLPPLASLPFKCARDGWGKRQVDVGEVTLQVACRGEPESDAPLIIALHGYPELHLAWNRLAPQFVNQGFAWVAPDQRGYNLSDKPAAVGDYHIDRIVDDLHGLVLASRRRNVLLIGHDWGGLVAFIYAHRYPERVRGLVVLNAPHPDIWGHPEVDPVQAMATEGYVPLLAGPAGGLAQPLLDAMLAPYLSPAELGEYRTSWEQPNALASMNSWYSANLYPDATMPTGVIVEVPTLVLFGMDDVFVTPSELDHLPDYVTDLHIVELAGVDHWTPHQATEAIVKRVLEFEASLPAEQP